jgi:DNA-binding NtrC family response regulator
MGDPFTAVLGRSDAAAAVRAFGRMAAAVDAPVLITGESGTGKGVLAAAIHRASKRARYPLVAVNCAGIAETLFESEFFGHSRGAFTGAVQQHRGLFEQAHRGSLFLDEIGELGTGHQAKLLTAIEDGEFRRVGAENSVTVDARIIAATGVDLRAAIARAEFRLDLYHRLLVLAFHMPPLRDRNDDCVLLARHFLHQSAQRYGRRVHSLDPRTETRLRSCEWPGNVRQLAHAIEAAVLVCTDDTLMPHHLPAHIMTGLDSDDSARYSFFGDSVHERQHILDALRSCHGNKTRAARMLGMARNTLRSRMAELRIQPAPAPTDNGRSSYVPTERDCID